MIEIHAHDIVNFAQCRRKDYYGRVRGWEPLQLSRDIEIGSVFHWLLAQQYKPGERLIEVSLDEKDMNLAQDMFDFYWQHYGSKETIAEIIAVEQEFTLPLWIENKEIKVLCRPDLLFFDEDHRVRLRDHKTKDKLPSDYDWFEMNLQMMIYQVLAKYNFPGYRIVVEHNLVRREVPPGFGHRPLMNHIIDKNGKEYDKKSTASQKPEDYVRMYSFQKSDETIKRYAETLTQYVREMLHLSRNDGPWLRSPGPLCGFCPFFFPCKREFEGEEVSDAEARTLQLLPPNQGEIHVS
jgi:hypothetical protein